ncbi:MAG: cytochrome c3 family protein [Planctomycetota bacterium]|jgi:mono/diheme cytochrome c family protein
MHERVIRGIAVAILALGGLSMTAGAIDGSTFDGVQGGLMWDKWWVQAVLPEPVGDHPLYPPAGVQTGSTTWRCKECHGWDYKGVDGAYGSGSHFTGIPGVFGTTMTDEEMFDLIKRDDIPNGHGYGAAGLTDDQICQLVVFVQSWVIDTDDYVDGAGEFIGDEGEGRYAYDRLNGYYTCAHCHGPDGTAINFGTPGDPTYVADIAADNPWELLHKVRIGHPGSTMTSWVLAGETDQRAADLGRYAELGFPAPPYVGDQACSGCHANFPAAGFYEAYERSGHPYKLVHTAGAVPPADRWPFTETPPLPVAQGNQLEWTDVEYVIGNYFWKARYIRPDGFIYTGTADETTQWNLHTEEWVPYHAGETDKPYNCGRCHTTGYQPDGNQLGLAGLVGTWEQDGVRCEACHGPASDHLARPTEVAPPGGKLCAECHYRDSQFRMPWKGGFMRHHQQSEDFSHSPHTAALTCNSCHNPHRSTVYDDGGVIAHCTDCHQGDAENGFYLVDGMESVDCKECHMPYMAKSAAAVNEYMGDVRGHIFRMTDDPIFAADNVYEDGGNMYWKQGPQGPVVTLDYACMGCHMEIGQPLTMEEASAFAFNLHTAHPASTSPPCTGDVDDSGTVDFGDLLAVIGAWGPYDPCPPFRAEDVDANCDVNLGDVFAVIAAWGPCP